MARKPLVAGEQDVEQWKTFFARVVELTRQVGEHPDRLPDVNDGLQALIDGRSLAKWSLWKTIQLGTHESVAALRQALIDADYKIGDWASDILNRITIASKPAKIELVCLTVAELGFPNRATRKQIYEKALSLGFELCPAEVGPQLRLQYTDQPLNEWLLVAMEPISDSDGSLRVFYVGHDEGGLWLLGGRADPGGFCGAGRVWVFGRK